jgi:hypothetical protein
MNSQEILNKIKVALGMEEYEVAPMEEEDVKEVMDTELADVMIPAEELEALRSERDDLKKKVDELQAIIDERDAKDKAINEVVDQPDAKFEGEMGEEDMKKEMKMSKPFSGAPKEEVKLNLASPKSNKNDVESRVFARMNTFN